MPLLTGTQKRAIARLINEDRVFTDEEADAKFRELNSRPDGSNEWVTVLASSPHGDHSKMVGCAHVFWAYVDGVDHNRFTVASEFESRRQEIMDIFVTRALPKNNISMSGLVQVRFHGLTREDVNYIQEVNEFTAGHPCVFSGYEDGAISLTLLLTREIAKTWWTPVHGPVTKRTHDVYFRGEMDERGYVFMMHLPSKEICLIPRGSYIHPLYNKHQRK